MNVETQQKKLSRIKARDLKKEQEKVHKASLNHGTTSSNQICKTGGTGGKKAGRRDLKTNA